MAKKRQVLWFEGIATIGEEMLQDAISFSVVDTLQEIEHMQGDGGGPVKWASGREVSGTVTFKAINAELVSKVMGGTLSTGTYTRVREGDETATITTNSITLEEAGDVVEDTIRLVGANGTVFKKVSESPAVGEFTYVSTTGVCTFNASETEETVYPAYVYADSSKGQTLSISKTDLPSQMELWGTLRTKNLNSSANTSGDVIIHLSKVNRTGDFEFGGENQGSTKDMTFNFSAIVDSSADYKMYFPA